MNHKLFQLINRLSLNPPVEEKNINKVEDELDIRFPCEYVDLMTFTNGAEGIVGVTSYITIWKIENIIQYNKGYAVEEFAPGLLIFGSDGGDTAYAFDTRDKSMHIFEVPFIGMDIEEITYIGNSFIEFFEYLSRK